MVGVNMGVRGHDELQAQLTDELDVLGYRVDDRVGQQCLASIGVCDQLGVGAGFRIEQLSKEHFRSPRFSRPLSCNDQAMPIAVRSHALEACPRSRARSSLG